MASKAGSTVKPKVTLPKTPAKVVNTNLDNITLSPGTLAILDSIFGSEAAFVHDPVVGPLILQVAKDGITDPARIKDYFMVHAVDASGKIQTVAPEKSWLGSQGNYVRSAIIEQKTNPGTYNQNVDTVLQSSIIPAATKLGINLSSDSLKIIAQNIYNHNWQADSVAIDNAIIAQYHFVPGAADKLSFDGKSLGGLVSAETEKFTSIASDYGITLPKNPAQMEEFIKGAIGPNGTEQDFTDWAKQQAIHAYPFLADALTRNSTVKGYLGNYATNIANVLDIPVDSISWADPKWQSLVNPVGATKLPNLNEVLTSIKLDPKYGYDNTVAAKNDAYDMAAKIKATFGFGA